MRKLFLITRWLLRSSLTSPTHITILELLWSAEGKNEEAISHYKMAIKINPDYAQRTLQPWKSSA